MRGRPPTPTNIKLLNGNPGKRPLNPDEPQLEVKLPECPEHLNDVARREWDRLGSIMEKMRVIPEADYQAFSMLCQQFAIIIKASEDLDRTGLMIYNKKSSTFQVNPLVGIIDKATQACNMLQSKFGLNPSDRTRIHAGAAKPKSGNRWAKVG